MLRNSRLLGVVGLAFTMMLMLGSTSFAADTIARQEEKSGVAVAPLSESEMEGLLFTREEEKVARDVYLTLGAQWNVRVFDNIAQSEQRHMDAVLTLVDRYGLTDPVGDNGIGIFTDPDLQAMYDDLVAQGEASLVDALEVGIYIEEVDILDLQELIAESSKSDLDRVYGNLLDGSENHLRGFVSAWERETGESYTPTLMTDDEFQAIVGDADSDTSSGAARRRGNRR
ncbi:MAG: DUF2202 domain-containing protein [Anaerolineales bacterium]|nr:DUF2202 domain-containing protein [Anaerolineales bacterium]MCB9126711.1 DUF2202 domain-containing protein [Ardenticatenales bacterium]MCB9171747.1 DUF2202 domain-containing protein [Ardenticatenales bacterium]